MAESVLEEAARLTSRDRQSTYGHPADDFAKTALMWTAILGIEITAAQIPLCMIAVKLSRECHVHKRDNIVDIAGYANTLMMVHECEEVQDDTQTNRID